MHRRCVGGELIGRAEQLRGAASEARAGVGRRGLRRRDGQLVGAGGQNRLDGAVVRAVVSERAGARGLQALRPLALAECDHALRGAQPLGDVVGKQPRHQLGALGTDRMGLTRAPLSVALEERSGVGRQVVGSRHALPGPQ